MAEEQTAEGAGDAEDCPSTSSVGGADAPRIAHDLERRENVCSGDVVDAAMRVHSEMGPGALEQVYKVCLAYELRDRGHHVGVEVPIPVIYRGMRMDLGYRADMIVDGMVIVEAKAASRITELYQAVLLSHLKLSKLRVGLIINFRELHLRDGIKRMVNRL